VGGKKQKNIIAVILVLLLSLAITQCTPKTQIVKEEEETVLRRRAEEYWSYKIKGEWDRCYEYVSPDYREKISVLGYINQNSRFPMKWEGFDILEVWTSGEEGYVKMNVKYRYIIPQTKKAAFERVAEEKWIKKEGHWYHLFP
jgi:hypothetical protein